MEKVILKKPEPWKHPFDILKEACEKYGGCVVDGRFYHQETLERFDGIKPKKSAYPETPYIH